MNVKILVARWSEGLFRFVFHPRTAAVYVSCFAILLVVAATRSSYALGDRVVGVAALLMASYCSLVALVCFIRTVSFCLRNEFVQAAIALFVLVVVLLAVTFA